MPSDDLVLNVRQIAGYSPTVNAPPSSALLIQLGGLGGPYASISPQALVSTALAGGGDMAINGALTALSFSGGSAQFSNAAINMFSAQKACIVDFAATWGTVGGVQIATINDISNLDAAQKAATVWSFNGRMGDVRLWIDDIRCAGGAPIYSPRFEGSPRACTPPPTSNSSRLATTAFVQNALGVSFDQFAPLDSPNFTGIPTAPTAALGSSDGQLATTAFVQNAVTQSTTGVASFNTRTGAVLLTAADVTSVGGALVASPSFTGVPTAVTATPGTSSTQLATCAFVTAAVAAVTAGVSSFNSRTGDVTLTSADVAAVAVSSFNGRAGAVFLLANDISAAGGALLAGPAFTGAPSAPTAALGTGTTQLATCAFVQNAVAAVTAGVTSWNGRSGAVTLQSADIAAVGGALLASPAFTGAPSAPTAAPGVSSTQLATTAFVAAAVSAGTAGVASFNSRTGAVTLLVADISAAGGALLASPAFTGIPTAPTALPSVSTTQLATCAFVNSVLPSASTAAPLVNGTASAGASAQWSRGDHVHPTDTTRAAQTSLANYLPLAGGTLTGALYGTDLDLSSNGNCAGTLTCTGVNGVISQRSASNPQFACSDGATNRTVLFFNVTNGVTALLDGYSGGILSLDPNANFEYGGSGLATKVGGGTWTAISDARIKTVEDDYALGLDEVVALRPVLFRYNGNDTSSATLDRLGSNGEVVTRASRTAPYPASPHYLAAKGAQTFVGLIAQEVETILPDMVTKRTGFIDGVEVDDLRNLDATPLIFALVNAVKTLAGRVAALEAA